MRADRLMGILLILKEKRKVRAEDLAKKFEVSVRTIYRDIDELSREYPVAAAGGTGGGFSLQPGYRLPVIPLSKRDVEILALLGSIAGQNLGLFDPGDFQKAYQRLLASLPPDLVRETQELADRIIIDVHPWLSFPDFTRNLKVIFRAVKENRTVKFQYQTYLKQLRPCMVDAYCLRCSNGFWSLAGYSHFSKRFSTYALRRIQNLVLTGKVFSRRADFGARRFWGKAKMASSREKALLATILCERVGAADEYLLDRVRPKIRFLKNEKKELIFRVYDPRELLRLIVSCRPGSVLVSPKSLRKMVKDELETILAAYR